MQPRPWLQCKAQQQLHSTSSDNSALPSQLRPIRLLAHHQCHPKLLPARASLAWGEAHLCTEESARWVLGCLSSTRSMCKADAQHAHTRTGSSRFFQHNMRPKCPASCLAALLVHTTSSACMLPGNCEPTVSRTPRQICSYQNVDLRAVPTLSQPGIFCEAR